MSRNGPASRFNISKPQPINNLQQSPGRPETVLPDFDFLGGSSYSGEGPYPSLPQGGNGQPYASSSMGSIGGENRAGVGVASARYNGAPAVSTTSLGSDGSPGRPERSKRRSQLPPPSSSRNVGSIIGGPREPRGPPAHIRERSDDRQRDHGRAPSRNGAPPLGLSTNMAQTHEPDNITPVTPASPVAAMPQASPGDPWAGDREYRSQARQMSKQSAYAAAASQRSAGASGGGAGVDKLRAAAGAFMSAKQREEPARRPPRRRAPTTASQNTRDNWDDLTVGAGGGKFAEIDCGSAINFKTDPSAVMRRIRKEWPFVLEGDVSVLLSLTDDSFLRHRWRYLYSPRRRALQSRPIQISIRS